MDDSTIDGISKRQYRIFMNSIHQDLKFATETEKGRLPTFASKTWSEAESVRRDDVQVLATSNSSQNSTD